MDYPGRSILKNAKEIVLNVNPPDTKLRSIRPKSAPCTNRAADFVSGKRALFERQFSQKCDVDDHGQNFQPLVIRSAPTARDALRCKTMTDKCVQINQIQPTLEPHRAEPHPAGPAIGEWRVRVLRGNRKGYAV